MACLNKAIINILIPRPTCVHADAKWQKDYQFYIILLKHEFILRVSLLIDFTGAFYDHFIQENYLIYI